MRGINSSYLILQASVERLEGQFKKWQSVKSYLQNVLHGDGNNNEGCQGSLGRQQGGGFLKVDYVDDSLCKLILDQLSDSIDRQVGEEGAPPPPVHLYEEKSQSNVRSKVCFRAHFVYTRGNGKLRLSR